MSTNVLLSTSTPTWQAVAAMIDHANLKPDTTPDQIVKLCEEAVEFGFGEVMVNSCYLELAGSQLRRADLVHGGGTQETQGPSSRAEALPRDDRSVGKPIKLASVIGFPFGACLTSVKEFEAAEALRLGAVEIDMVLNVGELKAGNHSYVEKDIRRLADLLHQHRGLLKVIIEAGLLTDEQKVTACQISVAAGADFVKTSTGFVAGGATVHDVALMRRTVGMKTGVKASGGIKTAAEALAMIEAGANRLGTSSGLKIVTELRQMQAAHQRGVVKAE